MIEHVDTTQLYVHVNVKFHLEVWILPNMLNTILRWPFCLHKFGFVKHFFHLLLILLNRICCSTNWFNVTSCCIVNFSLQNNTVNGRSDKSDYF